MKKIVLAVISILLCFGTVGCNSGVSQDEYDKLISELSDLKQDDNSISESAIDLESNAQSETTEKSDVVSSKIERTDLGISHDRTLDIIDSVEPVEEITFFDIPGYSVSVYKPGVRPLNIYILSDIETNITKAVMIKGEKSYFGANGNTGSFVSSIFNAINGEDIEGIEEFKSTKDEYQIFYLAPVTLKQELSAFPASLSELNSNGSQLLTNEEIDELYSYLERRDFQAIVDCLDSEITDPIMKKLFDLSSKAAELMENVTVKYDEVEEKSTLTYKDLSELSDNVHLLTLIDDSSLQFTMGFIASDWLFFDQITLKANNTDAKTHYFKSNNVNTEVVSGGVLEYVTIGLYDSEIDTLVNSDTVTIRFKNSDTGNQLDFELSEDELQAIRTLPLLHELRIQISNILYAQRNPV